MNKFAREDLSAEVNGPVGEAALGTEDVDLVFEGADDEMVGLAGGDGPGGDGNEASGDHFAAFDDLAGGPEEEEEAVVEGVIALAEEDAAVGQGGAEGEAGGVAGLQESGADFVGVLPDDPTCAGGFEAFVGRKSESGEEMGGRISLNQQARGTPGLCWRSQARPLAMGRMSRRSRMGLSRTLRRWVSATGVTSIGVGGARMGVGRPFQWREAVRVRWPAGRGQL